MYSIKWTVIDVFLEPSNCWPSAMHTVSRLDSVDCVGALVLNGEVNFTIGSSQMIIIPQIMYKSSKSTKLSSDLS